MDDFKELRQKLHQFPELSGEEYKTAEIVKKELKKRGIKKYIEDFSATSFVAVIEGEKKHGNLLFRCELDALPIQEENDFTYRSKNDGVSHKCGHDGHMTILVGLAEKLVESKSEFGNVYLLFQTAEETGKGAQEFVDSNLLEKLKIDFAFALHNVPGFEKGTVICKPSLFTPHVESILISLKGSTSHAGEPDKGVNPICEINEIASYLLNLHQPNPMKKNYCVVAPVFIEMGKRTFGTSAGAAEMGFTLRAHSSEAFENIRSHLTDQLRLINDKSSLAITWRWIEPFYSNVNDFEAYNYIKSAAQELKFNFEELESPFDWGEDFGLITQKVKGAMFGLGTGNSTKDLHDSEYDFPDDLITFGTNIFHKINTIVQNDLQQ